jgi:hypothetical protein
MLVVLSVHIEDSELEEILADVMADRKVAWLVIELVEWSVDS